MKKNNVKVTFKGGPITLLGTEAKVGDKAPDFVALNDSLAPVKLSDFAGKVVVVTSFPSVDTGVCAAQLRRFNKEAASLSEDVQIVTISADLPFALKRFCAAEGIDQVTVLSDHKELDFGGKYGYVIEELRLLARGTVVVDKNGAIVYVEYVPENTDEPNYQGALDAVKGAL